MLTRYQCLKAAFGNFYEGNFSSLIGSLEYVNRQIEQEQTLQKAKIGTSEDRKELEDREAKLENYYLSKHDFIEVVTQYLIKPAWFILNGDLSNFNEDIALQFRNIYTEIRFHISEDPRDPKNLRLADFNKIAQEYPLFNRDYSHFCEENYNIFKELNDERKFISALEEIANLLEEAKISEIQPEVDDRQVGDKDRRIAGPSPIPIDGIGVIQNNEIDFDFIGK